MTKKFYNSEKFQAWFFPILYFVLAISIVITSCFIFKKKYYQPIVVNGQSMWPTLAGGGSYTDEKINYHIRYNYGIADISKGSVASLHRFDVVVTYYPQGWNGYNKDYKIKRVWGFPGETVALTYDDETCEYTFRAYKQGKPTYELKSTRKDFTQTFEAMYYDKDGNKLYKDVSLTYSVNEFVLPNKTFRTSHHNPIGTNDKKPREFHKDLKDDEYFVMGDNWQGSTDSYENIHQTNRLTANDLQGRVICINAYATYNDVTEETFDMHNIPERYDF